MDGDLLELKSKVWKVPREGPTSAFTIQNSSCYAMIIRIFANKIVCLHI